jgi:hypothetical protein
MNWAAFFVVGGLVALGVSTAPWGLLILVVAGIILWRSC